MGAMSGAVPARGRRAPSSPVAVEVAGIKVEVVRKDVRNLNLRIRPDGEVTVSAPRRASMKAVTDFLEERAGWIEAHRAQVLARNSKRTNVDELTPAQQREARAALTVKLSVLVPLWEERIGVRCSEWRIRKMSSRWGSCSVESGRIRFAFQLAFESDECIEYIVVHELCHLLERGHGDRFKALMDRFLPDWRERRRELRQG